MKIDEETYGLTLKSYPPSNHSGYSPVRDGKILGRYKYHDVALGKGQGAIVMTYEDALKRCGSSKKGGDQ